MSPTSTFLSDGFTLAVDSSAMKRFSLDKTLGAYLIGTFVSAVLYGISCLQTFAYYRTYSKDRLVLRLTVAALWIFETLHIALNMHATYHYLVTTRLDPVVSFKPIRTSVLAVAATTVIVLITHVCYSYRVFTVTRKNWWIASPILALSMGAFVSGIVATVASLQRHDWTKVATGINTLTWARSGLALSVAADVLIAGSLVFYLHGARTGHKRTDTLVTKLIVITINNGVLTSLLNIAVLITSFASSTSIIYMAILQVAGNLYTNSLMATLNARNMLREEQGRLQEASLMRVAHLSDETIESAVRGSRSLGSQMKVPALTVLGQADSRDVYK
jgi:hypothetical protein